MKFVFKSQARSFTLVGVIIRRCFDIVFDSVDFLIYFVVVVEESSKVVIGRFELMDGIFMIRKLV